MLALLKEIPDPDVLTSLSPEELGAKLIFLLQKHGEPIFWPDTLTRQLLDGDISRGIKRYPQGKTADVEIAMAEAWAWLFAQGLIIPAEGTNGAHGFRRLSRRARGMQSEAAFADYRTARLLPREILHEKLADVVWRAFMRGEFDSAVLHAMKAVEVSVREAAGLTNADFGVHLMRKAFHVETGSLTDKTTEIAERQARSDLFAGVIGSYKNPHSHRDVNLDNPAEALEIIMLANHLLHIVDARQSALANSV
jgi:uncharacterized protein (TIGR02391 family)